MIKVLEAGLSTTIQDGGRYGHYHIGMPPSGAMDQFAHTVANYLVGNDSGNATVEMTYQGSDFKFTEDTVIAITGAEMGPELNGVPVSMWETHEVSDGDVLSLQFATNGARAYLAVAGGIDVTPVMESRSTYTLVGIGGYDGRTLEDGDTLTTGDAGSDRSSHVGNAVANEHIPNYDEEDHIRIVLGLCDYRLTDESKAELCDAEWTVTPEADRVGYRLEGPEIEFKPREQPFGAGTDPSNVVDLGYPVGSIQVPQKPIVLMRDAVTGGGYATVGTVISSDRDLLSQRRTHQPVYFQSVTLEEALAARNTRTETLETIRNSLAP